MRKLGANMVAVYCLQAADDLTERALRWLRPKDVGWRDNKRAVQVSISELVMG